MGQISGLARGACHGRASDRRRHDRAVAAARLGAHGLRHVTRRTPEPLAAANTVCPEQAVTAGDVETHLNTVLRWGGACTVPCVAREPGRSALAQRSLARGCPTPRMLLRPAPETGTLAAPGWLRMATRLFSVVAATSCTVPATPCSRTADRARSPFAIDVDPADRADSNPDQTRHSRPLTVAPTPRTTLSEAPAGLVPGSGHGPCGAAAKPTPVGSQSARSAGQSALPSRPRSRCHTSRHRASAPCVVGT